MGEVGRGSRIVLAEGQVDIVDLLLVLAALGARVRIRVTRL